MNSILSSTTSWFKNNLLTLNLDKTNYMCLKPKLGSKNPHPLTNLCNLQCTEETKFLGLTIAPNLSWNNHILQVINKIKPGIAILFKLRGSLPTYTLLQIYFSLIQSHLSYAILIWGSSPQKHISKLLKLQKKAVRIIAQKCPRTSCRPLFSHYKILTVTSLYILEASCHAKKALLTNYNTDKNSTIRHVKDIHSHNTRQQNNIYIRNFTSTKRKTNISFKSSLIYNNLPEHLKQINSLKKFRADTKKHLLDKTIYSLQEYQSH